ncbi:MAG TPA: CPBP family intramembrane glutamic endopeptidase [Gemmatimonadaceae bacterium]|nr:CPBP family intramembrane glutamic endopeptidase [Gemmatimonadaceae bacterium]
MPEDRPSSPFDRLRTRWLVVQFLLLMAAALLVYDRLGRVAGAGGAAFGGNERLGATLVYCALGLVLLVRGKFARLNWRGLFGRLPTRAELPLLAVVVPVDLLTLGATMAVFIPLSYVAPRFVERIVLGPNDLLDARSFGQWLGVVLLASVVAPFVEELFFRGILLHRWARRWGTGTAVVASSLLFAVLRGEWIGHFLFGVAMCALYLRSRTLWLPILAHAVSNLAIALTGLPDALSHAPSEPDTLASLRSQWPFGVLALAAGAVLLWWYVRRYWASSRLRAVFAGPVPYDVYAASATGSPDSTSAS